MSGLRRFTMHPDRLLAEHEHARTLAATGLVEALSPADAAALAGHLDTCRDCRQAALDYAFQGERIHGLPPIELPRDAWPAFAARLDVEEARVAEQRARRAGSRRVASQAHPLGGRPSRAPGAFVPVVAGAGHRGAPVAASVGVGSLLALVATIALVASGLPQMIAGPAATPFAVDPSSVAWVTRQADGRFLLQAAALDSACPSGGAACTDFGQKPSTIVALDMEPASVFLARDGRDAVIVDAGAAGAGTSGGSVYAIQLPTPYPGPDAVVGATPAARTPAPDGAIGGRRPSPSTAIPGGIAAGAALATAIATAVAASPGSSSSPRSTPLPVATPPYPTTGPGLAAPTRGPVASFVTAGGPGASLPAAVPLPTAAATRAIAEDVILVGGRAGYSPDGRWFAFSARPADASTGPDVYLWRVGDERSRAVTDDHAAVFAGWAGDRMLVSSPDGSLAIVGEAPARSTVADVAKGGAAAAAMKAPKAAKGAAATTAPEPAATPKPRKTASAAPDADAAASADGAAASGRALPATAPTDASPTAGASAPATPETTPVSYLLDPVTGKVTAIDLPGLWLPSVDPTGSRVVAWLGSVRADADGRVWRPAVGSLVVGSWPTVLAGDAASPAPARETRGTGGSAATTKEPDADADAAAATPTETAAAAGDADGATPAPDADATTKPDADATSAPDPDATTRPDASAGDGAAVGAPHAAPSASAAAKADADAGTPTALAVAGLTGVLPSSWLVRWDPTGTHLAIWIADAETPEVGKLSLLAVDPAGGKAPVLLLSSAPAMPGFAMGKSRIAWATPADGTPAGGRVRVLVWSGAGVGEAGTAPIRGLETLVEAD